MDLIDCLVSATATAITSAGADLVATLAIEERKTRVGQLVLVDSVHHLVLVWVS